ncbi:MAG: GyrI-like domain-containing protein [Gammaproteobacteria bacterium]|nr:GyrI-like domain-containing protein [Gammaproteobacteria bacterium]
MSQFEIEEVELTPQPALVIKFTSTPQTLGDKLGRHFPAIFQYAQAENLTLTGMPFVRYLEMTDVFTVEAGMPVAETGDGAGEGDIYVTELAGGSAITTDYHGPYDGLGAAHEALRTWAIDHGYQPEWGGWEIYETDPGSEPDSSKWLTRVYLSL